jgi:putative solute:sodium symporter small subunit
VSTTNGDDPAEPGEPAGDAVGDGTGTSGRQDYWRANLKLSAVLLGIWFVVSFGFGILLVEPLNEIRLFGFKLGFWWAQQGSIYVFLVLIFVYAWAMARIDRKYDVHEDDDRAPRVRGGQRQG